MSPVNDQAAVAVEDPPQIEQERKFLVGGADSTRTRERVQ